MSATLHGVAPMAAGAAPTRPSGRYRTAAAPELIGPFEDDVLVAKLRLPSGLLTDRFVRVESGLALVGADGDVLTWPLVSWRFATSQERADYLECRQGGSWT